MLPVSFVVVPLLISHTVAHSYAVRYRTHDVPCSILSMDTLWIRCVINQSDPLRFVSSSRSTRANIEFLTDSIENLTLPMNFFAEDDRDRRSRDSRRSFHLFDSILFDTTQLSQIQQLEISNGTFAEVLSTKINLVFSDCGQPMVKIRGSLFSRYTAKHLFVILRNLNRTVLFENFISGQCLMDDEIVFDRNDETKLAILLDLHHVYAGPSFGLTKTWINGILLGTTLCLTCLLTCLTLRQGQEASATSIVVSTSEVSFTQQSDVP